MKLEGISCKVCGCDELVAVEPGADAVYAPLVPSLDGDRAVVGKIVLAPRTDTGWCRQHWPWPVQGDIFARFA